MNRIRKSLIVTSVAMMAIPALAQLQTPRASPSAKVMQTVGLTDIELNYSRPGARGRQLWGSLVPYGEVWRTGANEATTIEVSRDVLIGGAEIPAGKYSIFTIPERNSWTVIINSNHEQWGSNNYDSSDDVARIRVPAREGDHVERMTFHFPDVSDDSATLEFAWGELRLEIPIQVGTHDIVLESARDSIADMRNWRTPYRAANWGLNANVDDEELLDWSSSAVALEENWYTASVHARVLARLGRNNEAINYARKALEYADQMENRPNTEAIDELLEQAPVRRIRRGARGN